jgi:hypothetical protein
MDEQQAAQKDVMDKLNKDACAKARQNLAVLASGNRVVHPDAKGEPRFLSPEEIAREKASAEQIIAKTCTTATASN